MSESKRSFIRHLKTQPSANVTATLSIRDSALVSVSLATITFPLEDWYEPVDVTVTWLDVESAGSETITHSVSGGDYDSVADATVTVNGPTVENAGLEISERDITTQVLEFKISLNFQADWAINS